jgi:TorA maturation chaperone TorD
MALSPLPSAQAMAAQDVFDGDCCRHRRLKTHAKAFMDAFDPAVSKRASSLHASTHVNREQTDLYQELIRWYDHFGLKRRDGGELPDHLAVMLEFMQFLTFQEQANAADAKAVLHPAYRAGDFILAPPRCRWCRRSSPRRKLTRRAIASCPGRCWRFWRMSWAS